MFEAPCGHQNGHALDAEGRVVACEHGGRRISRLDHDGVWRPLATHFDGKRLNSPNDVIIKSDGSIWFSDPTFGIDGFYEGALAENEIGEALVFRLDPASGELTAVARDRVRPNGLAFSPDQSILYVADTGETQVADTPRAIHAYAVGAPAAARSPIRRFSPSATMDSSTGSVSTFTAPYGRRAPTRCAPTLPMERSRGASARPSWSRTCVHCPDIALRHLPQHPRGELGCGLIGSRQPTSTFSPPWPQRVWKTPGLSSRR